MPPKVYRLTRKQLARAKLSSDGLYCPCCHQEIKPGDLIIYAPGYRAERRIERVIYHAKCSMKLELENSLLFSFALGLEET